MLKLLNNCLAALTWILVFAVNTQGEVSLLGSQVPERIAQDGGLAAAWRSSGVAGVAFGGASSADVLLASRGNLLC